MDILEEIVAHKRVEVERLKEQLSEREIHSRVEALMATPEGSLVPSMKKAIKESSTGIISEFKRKSPSKGWIKEEGKAGVIPLSYQQNGASAISILTDYEYFGGKDEFIVEARKSGVTIPVLYKNFVIDEYQLFQARLCGASAALLIAAELSKEECRTLLRTAHDLQLEPDLCGINNRNLGTFITSVDNSFRLASILPKDAVKVSESGISNPDTIRQLQAAGFKGFLIGECFMKKDNPGESLAHFISQI